VPPEPLFLRPRNVRGVQTLARGVNGRPRLAEKCTRTSPGFGRLLRGALAAVAALALLVSGATRVGSGTPGSVEIRDSKYAPEDLVVAPGTTVRWVNQDEETHTVTSTTEAFKSGGLNLGDEYTHTFAAPGVYPYTCALHEFMHGTIVVK